MRLPFAARSLSYTDAVKLLVPGKDPIVAIVGQLAGVAATGVTVASAGTVDFFALRDQLVSWGHSVAGSLRERITGVSRFDRTERLIAAHSVLVVTAFYEALDEALTDYPAIDPKDVQLTADEQVALSTQGWPGANYRALVDALIAKPPPVPSPDRPFETVLGEIENHYSEVADSLMVFLMGLAAFEHHRRETLNAVTDEARRRAVRRYVEGYRRLTVDAPEFAVWVSQMDSQATRVTFRAAVSDLQTQLDELRSQVAVGARILATMTTGAVADARRTDLASRYRRRLERRILDSAAMPAHVVMPSLGEAYVNPRCRVAEVGRDGRPAQESWWVNTSTVEDLEGFLRAHLTTAQAVSSPLVVLGQPGSGKSVLTRVLAARLPENDFMVVRVELRGVPADASVQDQIQEALYQEIGDRVSWPDLARSAGDALPVVILDGFDELLQATGLNQADYLMRVQQFQEREADMGRPAAVLVTTRTVVADRARFPDGTVAVRLEPFDDDRVRTWLDVWNTTNATSLSVRSLQPLTADAVLAHPELAAQPLLLLLLALYDSGANALQRASNGLGRAELYERLFADFINREVDKHGADVTDEQRTEGVAREWRRLAIVALAILNRGGDVITEAELNVDLPHLLDPADLPQPAAAGMNRALTAGQFMVGRFFFIHDSQATRDVGSPEKSYEFLHATFSDFLAARLIVEALVDLAEDRVNQRSRRAQPDAGFLYAAISFATITRRPPLREFCLAMLAGLVPDRRTRCRELVVELLPDSGYPHPTWSLQDYQPHRRPTAARHAAFSANLVWLAVALSDGPVPVVDLVGHAGATAWRQHALLWESQLSHEDFEALWQSLRVMRDPDMLTVRHEDGGFFSVFRSLSAWWTWREGHYPDLEVSGGSSEGHRMRRHAFTQEPAELTDAIEILIPFWESLGDQVRFHPSTGSYAPIYVSSGRALLDLLLRPIREEDLARRIEVYGDVLRYAALNHHYPRYNQLVWQQLRADAAVLPPLEVAGLIAQYELTYSDLPQDLIAVVAVIAARLDPRHEVVLNLIRTIARAYNTSNDENSADKFAGMVEEVFAAARLSSPLGRDGPG